jgi:hypothetical protein
VTWNDVEKISGVVKDLATGGAAVTAAIIAVKGLKTWKRQLLGNTNYDLARRFLRATYKLREAIRYVRMPFMSAAEIIEARKAVGLSVDTDTLGGKENERVTYQIRWRKLSDALVEFNAELLESEALWGKNIRARSELLLKCVGELNGAINEWLRSRTHLNEARDIEVVAIIYDAGESNSYSDRLGSAIEAIENELRPHLKL